MSETEIIDAELVETPAPTPPQMAPATLFGTSDPREVIKAATEHAEALTEILEDKQMYVEMGKGRRHVMIQGWATLGSMTGVFASVPEHTVKEIRSDRGEVLGWEARAEARTLAGQLVGAAEAECRWAESKWAGKDSYALKSMAQTRAQSKALAMPLRWIVELAGFAGTPAEEMPSNGADEAPRLTCPSCEKDTVVDNREAKAADAGKDKWPAFGCRNNDCKGGNGGRSWATWDEHFYEDPSVKAKLQMVAAIAKDDGTGWRLYFPAEDPDYSPEEAELIAGIHETNDHAQMAGYLWTELVREQLGSQDGLTNTDYRTIVVAAQILLDDTLEGPEEIMGYPQAWELAEMQMAEDDAEMRADDGMGYGA